MSLFTTRLAPERWSQNVAISQGQTLELQKVEPGAVSRYLKDSAASLRMTVLRTY
ncbi:protein of unknown function [Legionella longbeachae NSW150]|uniref:Uncharacterized protein n=1 Tax=Legionella longbeachae serogroup 1 (strain NSW150) TaxID=661367 RepID=D3HQI6_LEGLN|nr:protein of unknown function [Legionella longbeachae NSW150]